MLRHAITDRQLFPGDQRAQTSALIDQARRLAAAGVDLLQLREKDLSPPELDALAEQLRAAMDAAPPPHTLRLLLNGPARIAVATRLDGVHLRTGSTPDDINRVRESFGAAGLPQPFLSLSCHSLADVRAAQALGLDFLLLGPIFEKRVRGELVSPGLGLDLLRESAAIPGPAKLLALGGVTPANTSLCLEAGAAGIAGIRLFL